MNTLKVISLLTITMIVIFCLLGYWTNRQLELDKITLPLKQLPKKLENMKIMHVSDIHYGRLRVKQETLVATIEKEQPDFIFITGDTIDRTDDLTVSGIQELINQFAAIAPTYIVEGNHEQTSDYYDQWRHLMQTSQGILLENDTLELSFKGQPFSLIGLKNKAVDLPASQKTNLDSQSLSIMLAHHPELINQYAANFNDNHLDIVLSGHAHGGQIRLPFIDGLLSPNQGFFPIYTNGHYVSENQQTNLIVSRGLANSSFPFRINNKPHLISVSLTKK